MAPSPLPNEMEKTKTTNARTTRKRFFWIEKLVCFQVQKDRLPDKVNFRVSIPGAEAVAVVANQEWTHLERGEGNEWSGPVKVGHCYGTNHKVTLNANFGGDKTSYATLLEYVL